MRIEGEEVHSNVDVKALLEKIRRDPRTSNPRVLAIDQMEQQRLRAGGYPIHLHHNTLDPQQVHSAQEEEALIKMGFRREYRTKEYPCYLFRRNMHPKYFKSQQETQRITAMTPDAQRIEMNTVNEMDYIEEKLVKTADEAAKLLAMKPNKSAGTSAWFSKVTDLPPFEDAAEEDPNVTIANLRGKIEAMEAQVEQKRGPGRPPKTDAA